MIRISSTTIVTKCLGHCPLVGGPQGSEICRHPSMSHGSALTLLRDLGGGVGSEIPPQCPFGKDPTLAVCDLYTIYDD